jgi:nucleoside-diphosphate-sugar epimerase
LNIIILGSEGFIGKYLVRFFFEKGWNVHGADVLEVGTRFYQYHKISRLSPEFDELLQSIDFTACVNAAGSGNVSYSISHPLTDFEANSLDVIRCLDAIRRHRPFCKFLHISSAAVYGNPATLPIKESDPLKPVSPYGWHKLISEQICQEYSGIYDISVAIARPFSVYGPGLKKQLIWDLYLKCLQSVNGAIELWGTGTESRDFIYIEDLVLAFYTIIQFGKMKGEVYNVASGIETTIKEVSRLFLNALQKTVLVRFNQQIRVGDPINWRADISRLKAIGFTPKTDISHGLTKTAEWLKDSASA